MESHIWVCLAVSKSCVEIINQASILRMVEHMDKLIFVYVILFIPYTSKFLI